MITKKILDDLYKWASVTDFPLRNEVITSKYMGYGMKICHLKIGKNRKRYPNKEISKTVMNILMRKNIYGAYYVYYPPRMTATPHVDYNPYGKKYLRIQIPIKIPNNNNNNECYIEWIECGQRIYWKEGESRSFRSQYYDKTKGTYERIKTIKIIELLFYKLNKQPEIFSGESLEKNQDYFSRFLPKYF